LLLIDASVVFGSRHQKAVPSLCWSPNNATVFACVNEGALEIWDLDQSMFVSCFSSFRSSFTLCHRTKRCDKFTLQKYLSFIFHCLCFIY